MKAIYFLKDKLTLLSPFLHKNHEDYISISYNRIWHLRLTEKSADELFTSKRKVNWRNKH